MSPRMMTWPRMATMKNRGRMSRLHPRLTSAPSNPRGRSASHLILTLMVRRIRPSLQKRLLLLDRSIRQGLRRSRRLLLPMTPMLQHYKEMPGNNLQQMTRRRRRRKGERLRMKASLTLRIQVAPSTATSMLMSSSRRRLAPECVLKEMRATMVAFSRPRKLYTITASSLSVGQ